LLDPLHFRSAARGFIVIAMQVKKAVDEVQPELSGQGISELPRLPRRGLRTNEDLAVLEGNHIGRAGLAKKTAVQLCHPAIGDQDNADLIERPQDVGLSRAQFEAPGQSLLGESL